MMSRVTRVVCSALAVLVVAGASILPAVAAERPARVDVGSVDAGAFPDLTLQVTASDANGTPIAGLTGENFELLVDGVGVPIEKVEQISAGGESVAVAL